MENLPTDHFVRSSAFTAHSHRDMYPSIDPSKNPSLSQAGRVVVIVGASAGIGLRGLVPVFAAAKPKALVLVARSVEGLEAAKKSAEEVIANHGGDMTVDVIAGDVGNLESIASVWEQIKDSHGHADVLVNSAGAMGGMAPVGQVDIAKWWTDFDINVRGFYANVHHFVTLLGSERKGYIVNLATSLATYVEGGTSSYSISKLAAWKVCEFLTKETAGRVQAVSIHPGLVHTQLTMGMCSHGFQFVAGTALRTTASASLANDKGREWKTYGAVEQLLYGERSVDPGLGGTTPKRRPKPERNADWLL